MEVGSFAAGLYGKYNSIRFIWWTCNVGQYFTCTTLNVPLQVSFGWMCVSVCVMKVWMEHLVSGFYITQRPSLPPIIRFYSPGWPPDVSCRTYAKAVSQKCLTIHSTKWGTLVCLLYILPFVRSAICGEIKCSRVVSWTQNLQDSCIFWHVGH